MLGDIDRSLEPIEFELILCKPDKTQIAVLAEAKNINYSARFPTTDELQFTIPYYTMERGRKVKNPNWDLVQGDYLILLNNEKYFVIAEPENTGGDMIDKTLLCYSREYELNRKIIRGYDRVSRKLYTVLAETDEDGELRGVINYLSTLTSWSFDTDYLMGNPSLSGKYRAFNVSEKTLLDFLIEDVQKAYGCVFLFDTINKKINIKELEDVGEDKGLYISEKNYLEQINEKIKHDDIVTRLYPYGKDDITINKLNPIGTPYIEDFSFFKTATFMTKGLIDALNAYELLIKTHNTNGTFDTLLSELNALYDSLIVKNDELSNLKASLDSKQDEIDSAIKLGQDLTALNNQKATIESSILTKESEISTLNTSIESKIAEINTFRNSISKENNFTSEQLTELDYYIREKSWSDSTYETEEDLYVESEKQLKRISQPPIDFNIDIVDFLRVVESQFDWGKLILGDLVTIEFEKFGLDIKVRLIGFERDDEGNLSLQFSSKDNLDDPFVYLKDLQKQAITTSTALDMSKYKWDKSEENESAIKELIENDLDAARNNILAGNNQGVKIDKHGIWLTEKDEFGNIKPEQMRIINNMIVISDDGFKTAKTAISPPGVSAEVIKGKMIIGQQGLFDGIDIFGGGVNPIVSIGKYLAEDGVTDKYGIQVKDLQGRERVVLGNYNGTKYGLLIKDSTGVKTILDEDGILQTWQDGRTDNVESGKPLRLNVYIPDNTRIIHKAILRFKREYFRAYSKGAASDGGSSLTSASSSSTVGSTTSGGASTPTSELAGSVLKSTTAHTDSLANILPDEAVTSGQAVHNHGLGLAGQVQMRVRNISTGVESWKEFVPSGAHTHGSHSHSISIGSHSHSVSIPSHSHNVTIPSHTHSVTTPDHTHGINYGIYESTRASGVTVTINGYNRTIALGGSSGFTTDQNNLDITSYLTVGQWNTIELGSSALGRIDATVFIQALMNASI